MFFFGENIDKEKRFKQTLCRDASYETLPAGERGVMKDGVELRVLQLMFRLQQNLDKFSSCPLDWTSARLFTETDGCLVNNGGCHSAAECIRTGPNTVRTTSWPKRVPVLTKTVSFSEELQFSFFWCFSSVVSESLGCICSNLLSFRLWGGARISWSIKKGRWRLADTPPQKVQPQTCHQSTNCRSFYAFSWTCPSVSTIGSFWAPHIYNNDGGKVKQVDQNNWLFSFCLVVCRLPACAGRAFKDQESSVFLSTPAEPYVWVACSSLSCL